MSKDVLSFRVHTDRLSNGAWLVYYSHGDDPHARWNTPMQSAAFEQWESAEKYIIRLTRKLMRDAMAEEMKKELPPQP